MAERRMFSKTIIECDKFIDMPLSSQCLYFHLSMNADDDGFVDSPKKIKRSIGCTDDDLKILVSKGFIIPFESGVVVITHWNVNNSIRGDRKKSTLYTAEKSSLALGDSGEYCQPNVNQLTTKCQPIDNQTTAQYSIDKISIDKNSKDKDSIVLCKHAHGFFSNVFLTDEEMQKLSSEIPNLDDYIERLSNYLANNKKEYKSHCATIRNWYRRDVENTEPITNHDDETLPQAPRRKSY